MTKLENCLAQAPVFSKLEPDDLADLSRLAVKKTYQKGEFICWQGRVWPKVLYLESGLLEWAMLSPEGKRQVVFRLKPCATVWGHSFFDDQPMPASLEVRETSEVYTWSREVIKPVVSQNIKAVWDVSQEMVRIMRKVRGVVYGFAFHPVAGRLARLLLEHYQPADGMSADRNLTLEQMANSIGSTIELVSKTLHQFAAEGMIEISRMQFVFSDREKLETLAGEDNDMAA